MSYSITVTVRDGQVTAVPHGEVPDGVYTINRKLGTGGPDLHTDVSDLAGNEVARIRDTTYEEV